MRPLLVTTSGAGSMDRYGQQLAAHLPVAAAETDVGTRSAELFGVGLASRAAAAALAADGRFVARLRALRGLVPHFANHHLARYGPAVGGPYLVTVHDLIRWFDLRGLDPPLINRPNRRDRLALRRDAAGVRGAMALVAVSEATRRDLVEHLAIAPDRVHVVAEGIDHGRFRPVAGRDLGAPYLLFVGSEHPRKDLITLLRAFALLKRERRFADLRLVKAGAAGKAEAPFAAPVAAAVRELGLEREVDFLGHVPDDELPALYSGAACLAFPSRYEGFGLPPLEAMACGCPVVASDAGALPETTGGAALTVRCGDPAALADALRVVIGDRAARAELVARGLARAAAFTWERAARELGRVYDAVLPGWQGGGASVDVEVGG